MTITQFERKKQQYIHAASRTLEWATRLLKNNGSFRGAAREVDAYYFGPLAFSLGGYVQEPKRILSYIQNTFLINGDINNPEDSTLQGAANFRNAWLCVGAHRSSEYRISYSMVDQLKYCQNPVTGGVAVYKTTEPETQITDMGTTAAASIAFLATGNIKAALQAGDFLANILVEKQPNAGHRILLRTDWDGKWLSQFPTVEAGRYEIQIGAPGQVYWFLGIAMAALAQLYATSRKEHYLQAGRTVFGWTKSCEPGVFEDLTAAKVGLGTSALYAATADTEFSTAATRVGDMLVKTQLPEGVWLRRPTITKLQEQPLAVSLSTSLERACWLLDITRNL